MQLILLVTVIFVTFICLIFFVINRTYSYWRRIGNIPYVEPKIPYGNIRCIGNHEQLGLLLNRLYLELKGNGPIGGLYILYRPFAIAISLDFVKHMLIRDFNHFEDRGLYYNEKRDPISAHLLNLDGEKWRPLRNKLSPTFTSGKMRLMFPMVMNVAKQLDNYLLNLVPNQNGCDVEIRNILYNFTIDVIGTCAFGIECNSLTDPVNQFRVMGIQSFERRKLPIIMSILLASHQSISKLLRLKLFSKDVSNFFTKIVADTISVRQMKGIARNDFLDLIVKLKQPNGIDAMLKESEIVAQSFLFFTAAFETSATTMTYAMWELAKNMNIQNRLRNDIKQVIAKHAGHFTYEAMMELEYLNQVIYGNLLLN